MLTGKVPFTGDTPVEIAMKHLSQVPDPPSELRADVPHDLDAVVMRALAKDPDQRYASAEEMDADLARIARGVAVSRETEDAMTQVISGAGISTAATMIQRPRTAVAPPPAPPVYRAPGGYYDYEEPPRGRSIWPWLLALGLIIAGAIGGYYLYQKIQDQLNSNKPVAVPNVLLLQRNLAVLKLQQAGLKARVQYEYSDSVNKGQVAEQNPSEGSQIARNSSVTVLVSTHYMDEAVQCDFITYIAYGKKLIDGPSALIPTLVGLETWRVEGPDLGKLAERLKHEPGVEQVARFGASLHISGTDKATLGQTVERLEAEGTHHWTLQIAGLEEAFIYLMAGARDNFAGDPAPVAA